MRRGKRMSTHPPELNLVPLLDMVSLLIQLMLINAQFGSYAELPGSAAVQVPGVPAPERLSLRVTISPEGYEAAWLEAGQKRSEALPCKPTPCAGPDTYDRAALLTLAERLKALAPTETQVVLSPRGDVVYESVTATMDTLRAAGSPPRDLFPEIVFAGGVR